MIYTDFYVTRPGIEKNLSSFQGITQISAMVVQYPERKLKKTTPPFNYASW